MKAEKRLIVITVVVAVLFLIVASLTAVLYFKAADGLNLQQEDSHREEQEDADDTDLEIRPAPEGKLLFGLITGDNSKYSQALAESFLEACKELSVSGEAICPQKGSSGEQLEAAEALIAAGVDAIAIVPVDSAKTGQITAMAQENEIPVVSINWYVSDVQIHIDGSDWQTAALALLEGMYDVGDGESRFGVAAPDSDDMILRYMEDMYEEDDRYEDTRWKGTFLSGGDSTLAEMLEENPGIEVVCCTTEELTVSAARLVEQEDYDVQVIGIGAPSSVKSYLIKQDCIAAFYAFDPQQTGIAAACALEALVKEKVCGEAGEEIETPYGDEFDLLPRSGSIGRVEIPLVEITEDNIKQWAKIY